MTDRQRESPATNPGEKPRRGDLEDDEEDVEWRSGLEGFNSVVW